MIKKRLRENNGITLIALVITIVVLIILAAVAINLSLGNNGIFNRAKTAKEQYTNAHEYERTEIGEKTDAIDSLIDANRSSSSKVTVLYDGLTDSQRLIDATSGTAAERTLYDDVKNYDFVYVYGAYKNETNEYYYMTPAIIHKSFFDMDAAFGGLAQFSSTFNQCSFTTKIDSVNNKIILTYRGSTYVKIAKVIGVKY